MKLEIEVNVADYAADKAGLQEYLRKEAILFADRKITAGKAVHELGMLNTRLVSPRATRLPQNQLRQRSPRRKLAHPGPHQDVGPAVKGTVSISLHRFILPRRRAARREGSYAYVNLRHRARFESTRHRVQLVAQHLPA